MLKIRLVSYFTPTHEDMCRRFVMDRSWDFHDRQFLKFGQTCPTGEFKKPGWNECMLDKLKALLSLPTDGMPTLYVDSDVALFPGLCQWLSDNIGHLGPADVAFSNDIAQLCAGIMVFYSTPQVHEFWRTVLHCSRMWNLPDQEVIDQFRMHCDERGGAMPINPLVLPSDVFANWATLNAPEIPSVWNGEPFELPATCKAWHANWVVGIDRKLQMLEHVTKAGNL